MMYPVMFFRFASLPLGQSYDCLSTNEVTLKAMGKIYLCLTLNTTKCKPWAHFPGMHCRITLTADSAQHMVVFDLSLISESNMVGNNNSSVKFILFMQFSDWSTALYHCMARHHMTNWWGLRWYSNSAGQIHSFLSISIEIILCR